jgi:ribonuclease HI
LVAKNSKKYYVVWAGRDTGIFDTWDACKGLVAGFDGAKYKSFPTREQAEQAFHDGPGHHLGKNRPGVGKPRQKTNSGGYILNSIAVDAACNMVTGQMEYQGVYTDGAQPLFHQGPFQGGSNNIGEFLAIVHALAWCRKHHADLPVYTDSNTALAWVRKKKANTKVAQTSKNKVLFDLVQRAETWLQQHHWTNPLLKWNTEAWGEIPADFGRK